MHFDLVKSPHTADARWQRDSRAKEIIIAGWVGEKSPLRRMQGNERGYVTTERIRISIGAIPAMGYIPEAGFTSGRRVRDRR